MNSSSFLRSHNEDSVPSYVLYSPQGSKPLAGLVVEGGTVGRYYDKATKSQLLQITPSTHVSFLRSASARAGRSSKYNCNSGLATGSQRIIILQLFCEESSRTAFSITIELLLQDKIGRRRIIFCNSFHKYQRCAQHVKVPLRCALPGMWLNLVFDVPQIHAVLYGETGGRLSVAELSDSRRLLSLTISSSCICRVRRVLGMPQLPPMVLESYMSASVEAAEWPFSLRLPEEVPVGYYIIRTGEEEFLQFPLARAQSEVQPAGALTSPFKVLQAKGVPAPRSPSLVQSTRTVRTVGISTAPLSSAVSESTAGYSDGVAGVMGQFLHEQERIYLNAGTSTHDLSTVSPDGCRVVAGQQQEQQNQQQHAGATSTLERRLKGVYGKRSPVSPHYFPAKRNVGVQTEEFVKAQTAKPLFEEPRVNGMSLTFRRELKGQHGDSVRSTDIDCIIIDEEACPRMEGRDRESGKAAQVTSSRAIPQHRSTITQQLHDDDGDKARIVTNKVLEPTVVEDSVFRDSNSHIPSLPGYHQTLDMMRERVKCIQALIGDSTGYRSGRGDGSRGDEMHGGGKPHMHPSADYSVTQPGGDVHLRRQQKEQQQQQQQQQGLCSSPHFPNSSLQRVNRELSPFQCTLRAPTERQSSPDELAHTCTAVRKNNRSITITNKNGYNVYEDEDEEDEDEDGFTVNVCLSEERERPAVVVPAEATSLGKKPPVSPPRPNAHAVDRLCFDSTFSDVAPLEPSISWSSRVAAQHAEEDGPMLSVPPSPSSAAAAAANTDTSNAAAAVVEHRSRLLTRRGRLGEHAEAFLPPTQSQQQEKEHLLQHDRPYSDIRLPAPEPLTLGVQEFLGRTTATSNTPLHSLRMSRGGEEAESSVSTSDYRRASGTGQLGICSGQFIRVGSAHTGDEVNPFHSSRLASLPPRSPTSERCASRLLYDGNANRVIPSSNHSGTTLLHHDSGALKHVDTGVTVTGTRVESIGIISSEKLLPSRGADSTRQYVEDSSGPFVFDPLLQCCLDLRSNTYIVAPSAAGYAQRGHV